MSDDPDEGLLECEWCHGKFDSADMDGEHCRDCAHELFHADDGDDETE